MIILFPLFAVLFSFLAIQFPLLFVDLKFLIVPLLMLVMLGMGLTLSIKDFIQVWQNRLAVGLGVTIQFLIMPFTAWLLSMLLGLSLELTIGMMLVGASAGGTASNVMAYLAKGDVALSVSMTLVSTLAAVFLLPMLTWVYLGSTVDVPVQSMLFMLIKMIVAPVVLGMLINHFWHQKLLKIMPYFPLFSMSVILLIIAIVVALNANNFESVVWTVVAAVILHNLIGLTAGYGAVRYFGFDRKIARTVAIEVGMQNSGLSVALALKYFTAGSALPGALFSIWHNISGAVLASYWARK